MVQARVGVFELRQLHLDAALRRLRMRSEDVQDQLAAVEHLSAGDLFQVTNLVGVQVVVEDDRADVVLLAARRDFRRLARADVQRPVDPMPVGDHIIDDLGPGRLYQAAQLPQRVMRIDIRPRQNHAHQEGALHLYRQFRAFRFCHSVSVLPRKRPLFIPRNLVFDS